MFNNTTMWADQSCNYCGTATEQDVKICKICEVKLGYTPSKPCTHKWVWSGVPRGSMWCKDCDIDYKEELHGVVQDLSEKTYV